MTLGSLRAWPVRTQAIRSSGLMTAVGEQVLESGDGRGGGRFAAEAVEADLGLGVDDLVIGDGQHNAVADIQGPQAFCEVDRPGDFDGRGEVCG